MKKIILYILSASVFLNAFGTETQTTITSDYLYRGVSQTQGQPALNSKIIAYDRGFHAGVWGSRVLYGDDNITNILHNINNTVSKASAQVDIFLGYEMNIGSSSMGVGYIDKRYLVDGKLDGNISNEYYVFLNFKSTFNTIIKASYDILNPIDPIYLEVSLREQQHLVGASLNYGTHLQSKSSYWDVGASIKLSPLNTVGILSLVYSQFSLVNKKEKSKIVLSYTF